MNKYLKLYESKAKYIIIFFRYLTMDIKVTPLGAGQDVGRSCLLLSIGKLSLHYTEGRTGNKILNKGL